MEYVDKIITFDEATGLYHVDAVEEPGDMIQVDEGADAQELMARHPDAELLC